MDPGTSHEHDIELRSPAVGAVGGDAREPRKPAAQPGEPREYGEHREYGDAPVERRQTPIELRKASVQPLKAGIALGKATIETREAPLDSPSTRAARRTRRAAEPRGPTGTRASHRGAGTEGGGRCVTSDVASAPAVSAPLTACTRGIWRRVVGRSISLTTAAQHTSAAVGHDSAAADHDSPTAAE
jgi:hypothetical protein